MNIYKTPRVLPLLFPGLLWRVKSSSAVVYLTFDDGPMPGPTDFVLDQLAAHRAHATFFCIGDNIRKHPQTFQRIRREGHLPANHTFNHLSGWGTGTRRYHENIQQCDDVLMKQHDEPRLFRPPYGRLNPAHRSNHRVVMKHNDGSRTGAGFQGLQTLLLIEGRVIVAGQQVPHDNTMVGAVCRVQPAIRR
ncbi:MAG: polysaccharide deacetylase family protein [Bacteroidota bacterium]